jgi:integrase
MVTKVGAMLTQKSIDNLKPGPARREVSDGRGLFFVLQPSGAGSWALRYRFNGRPRKLTLGPWPALSLKNAREKANEALVAIANDRDPGAEKVEARRAVRVRDDHDLVETVVASFLATYAKRNLKPRTAAEVKRILEKEIVHAWGRRRLSEIRPSEINDKLDEIVDRGAPYAANRTLTWFKKLCAWAVERELIAASPCTKIKQPLKTEQSRDRVLTDDELKEVWKAAETVGWPYGHIARLLILTGARRAEVTGLEWREIDLEAAIWTLPATRAKNKRQYVIPLSPASVEILKNAPRIAASEFVFTFSGDKPLVGYALIKDRIDELLPENVEPWRLHDLRRTFASGLARLGTPIHVVEKLLNHVTGALGGVAGIYNRHSYADEQRAAADTWGRYVETLVSGAPAGNVVQIKVRG